jgi:hypothetical protein
MKATLEFNLDDPEDRMAHLRCVHSLDMAIALFDIVYNLRKPVEYGQYKDAYEGISSILDEQGIDIDKLIT